jgi:hypothetical protein
MKIFRQEALPEGYCNGHYDSCEMSEYNFQKLRDMQVEEVRYWYATGSYCGIGEMLIRKNGKWYHHNMSHCSCYGPTEHLEYTIFDASTAYDNLCDILTNCSKDEIKNLISLINVPQSRVNQRKDIRTAEYMIVMDNGIKVPLIFPNCVSGKVLAGGREIVSGGYVKITRDDEENYLDAYCSDEPDGRHKEEDEELIEKMILNTEEK